MRRSESGRWLRERGHGHSRSLGVGTRYPGRLGSSDEVNGQLEELVAADNAQSGIRRKRSALPITETELSVIAALAQIGLISVPVRG